MFYPAWPIFQPYNACWIREKIIIYLFINRKTPLYTDSWQLHSWTEYQRNLPLWGRSQEPGDYQMDIWVGMLFPRFLAAAVAQWVTTFGRKRKFGCSNPSRERPKSLKQVVTAPLSNARHLVCVSWVLGDDHYKRSPRLTVGVAS